MMNIVNNDGLSTIENVRENYNLSYEPCNKMTKIKLKCWLYHSESRNRNNNLPFTYSNYINHMRIKDYMEQIKLEIIDCSDIGGKDAAIEYVRGWL